MKLLILLMLFLLPSGIVAKTLTVGQYEEHQTIGAALAQAEDQDLIQVRGGRYAERLVINKKVHLSGIGQPVITVVDGDIVTISSPDVIFEGFSLGYSGSELSSSATAIRINKEADRALIRNNRLLGVMFGVWNVEGDGIRIEKNTIIGIKGLGKQQRGNCVNLTGSKNVQVTDNTISYCRDGIYMELCHDATVTGNEIEKSRYSVHTMWVDRGVFSKNTVHENLVGLAIMYTKHSEINDNLSFGNRTHGLLLIQSVRSKVKRNLIIGNTKGIFIYNSIYNELSANLVMNNQLGIHNWGGSEDNKISYNSFIDNELQVKYVASTNQQWDKNYWSDYIGWDMTSDGIGDHQYESNSLVDHILWKYPLAKVLYTSPSLQLLWMIEKQFPIFEVPKVIDSYPFMAPLHENWHDLRQKYSSFSPERIYGNIEKLPHMPGGHH